MNGSKLSVVKFVLEFLTLIAVIAFAGLAFKEWQAMENSNLINRINAQAAQSAATTAQQELETNTQAFHQEERAYLWPNTVSVMDVSSCPDIENALVCANVHIANSGRTPAIGVHLYCYTTLGPDSGSVERAVKGMAIQTYAVPDGDMFGAGGDKWKACAIDITDEKLARLMLDGKLPIYVFGIVQYYDIFGEYHETGFCSSRLPNKGPFVSCPYGNWFDRKIGEAPIGEKKPAQ